MGHKVLLPVSLCSGLDSAQRDDLLHGGDVLT